MHRRHGCRRGLIGRGSAAEGRVGESLRREVTVIKIHLEANKNDLETHYFL